MDLQLVILGTGEPELEAKFKSFRHVIHIRMGLRLGFDEGLAHRIEGGADMFVMPSRYEPCGLSQLYSLRYGTVPVVRKIRWAGRYGRASDCKGSAGGTSDWVSC